MLNIIDKRLFEVLQKKIYLEEYGKKKLFTPFRVTFLVKRLIIVFYAPYNY